MWLKSWALLLLADGKEEDTATLVLPIAQWIMMAGIRTKIILDDGGWRDSWYWPGSIGRYEGWRRLHRWLWGRAGSGDKRPRGGRSPGGRIDIMMNKNTLGWLKSSKMTQLIIKMIIFLCLKLSPTLSCLEARRWKCAMSPVFTVAGLGKEWIRISLKPLHLQLHDTDLMSPR